MQLSEDPPGDVKVSLSIVNGHEKVGKDEGDDRHELHEDVERGAGGVLEGVADGVTDDGSLVELGALALDHAVYDDGTLLDVLLGVVPRAAGVGRGDGHLDGGGDGTREETRDGVDAEEDAEEEGGGHDEHRRRNHLAERRVGGDGDALGVVGGRVAGGTLEEAGDLAELPGDLLDHLVRSLADGLHRHGGEPVGDHRAEDEGREDEGRHEGDRREVETRAGDEGAEEGEADEAGGADGEALADGGGGVTRGVEGVGLLADSLGHLGHLGNAASVVADGAVDVDGEARGERAQHAERGESHAVHVHERERDEDDTGEDTHGDDGGLVAEREAVDDVGGGARLG
mmetsp:Transcript_9186/g.37550  ORF Transcript_9186/g.37550 Transcript_9186/m.37550 type:complete len:343 (+) Transcript_9186:60-1088(+)